jgi:hypothetical protein
VAQYWRAPTSQLPRFTATQTGGDIHDRARRQPRINSFAASRPNGSAAALAITTGPP